MKSSSVSASALYKISRRKLLLGGLALGSIGLFASKGLSNTSQASDTTDFLILSEFLTSREHLRYALAQRYYLGLHDQFPDLPAKITHLSQEIHASGARSMDDYLSHGPTVEALITAKTIVSAWYLGVIGTDSKKTLIAYSDALMFQAVAGALVVPSYGAGPLAWGNRPEPIMTFKEAHDEH